MTADMGIWLCTLHVERQHGLHAAAFVTKRIEDLERENNALGVAAWEAVGVRLSELRKAKQAH